METSCHLSLTARLIKGATGCHCNESDAGNGCCY